jgi:hypothetical protein
MARKHCRGGVDLFLRFNAARPRYDMEAPVEVDTAYREPDIESLTSAV